MWCYKVGLRLHEKVKAIRVKSHEGKAKLIFKYGLDNISNYLLTLMSQPNTELNAILYM